MGSFNPPKLILIQVRAKIVSEATDSSRESFLVNLGAHVPRILTAQPLTLTASYEAMSVSVFSQVCSAVHPGYGIEKWISIHA